MRVGGREKELEIRGTSLARCFGERGADRTLFAWTEKVIPSALEYLFFNGPTKSINFQSRNKTIRFCISGASIVAAFCLINRSLSTSPPQYTPSGSCTWPCPQC